jgi:bacteriocin biosynthesis cyclodehydratase domain-containing protein
MIDENGKQLLHAFPSLVVEENDGVRLRRGCVELRIRGEGAARIVRGILDATLDRNASLEEILHRFPLADHPAVVDLIDELMKRLILIQSDDSVFEEQEGPLEIFYWHFGEGKESINARIDSLQLSILGVNSISRQLVATLLESGISNIQVIDQPQLRNLRLFDQDGQFMTSDWKLDPQPIPEELWDTESLGCLIATSDIGSGQEMKQWNSFCLKHNIQFLPVVLQDMIGYVGPLVVPGETACFECMTSRWNSNLDGEESRWDFFRADLENIVGYHPAMASMLGSIAAFELTKFYGVRLPLSAVGRLIEVNLLTMEMQSRKVLRVPRCPACSSLHLHAPMSLSKNTFGLNEED